jgi:hypothetical protein
MAARNQQSMTDQLPLKEGAIFGVASFVAGYVATLIIVALTEADDLTSDLIEASGWIYYNAQFADVEISVTADDPGFGALLDGTTFNYVTDDEIFGEQAALETPSIIYHLLPILALILLGFLLARYVNAQTTQGGAVAGATLPLGVLPLAILGSFVFAIEEDGVELAPVLSESIILVGILFPLIFGAFGGALSTRV